MDFLKAAAAIEEHANEFFTQSFCEKAKGKTENFVFSALYAHTMAGMLSQVLRPAPSEALASKLGLLALYKEEKLDAALSQWYNRLKTISEFAATDLKCCIPAHLKPRSSLKNHISLHYSVEKASIQEPSNAHMTINIESKATGLKTKVPLRSCGKKPFKTLAGKKLKLEYVEATAATVRQGSFSGFTATELMLEAEASLALVLIQPRGKEQFQALLEDPNYILSACGAGGGDASWQMSSTTVRFPAISLLQSGPENIISIDSSSCEKIFRNKDKSSEDESTAGISICQSASIGFALTEAATTKEKQKIKCGEWTVGAALGRVLFSS
eukprot:TRINITY_DN7126_c0_g1_i1.p1 TRINITY_DN7126_c0_g1~~TRINITY_DN7126_c0_g1_i1.p1  ORF type:complete len:327 (+),score=43.75 TRINITY_DN7126_c0_g1_i1:155-1135(+)